jgi:DNA-binding PadR family transcriptional regulator
LTRNPIAVPGEELEKQAYDMVQNKVIKQFVDLIILSALKERKMSGYDIVLFIKKKYDLNVSPGTVYQHLYSMERKGLLTAISTENKRIYELSHMGEGMIEVLNNPNGKVMKFVNLLLKGLWKKK